MRGVGFCNSLDVFIEVDAVMDPLSIEENKKTGAPSVERNPERFKPRSSVAVERKHRKVWRNHRW
jgi:hypothetical protein